MAGTDLERRPSALPVPLPGAPRRRHQSEAIIPRALRAARRNPHLSVPLAIPPGLWTAAELAHALGAAPEVGCAGVAASAAVWWLAPHKWTAKDGSPRWPEVWYARFTVLAFSGWLTATALAGASGPDAAVSLLALSAAWGYPWWKHHRPRGRKGRERLLAGWQAWWDGHCGTWGFAGSRVISAEEMPAQVRIRVQLCGGRQSLQSLQGQVHLVESALDGVSDIGMVRIVKVKGHPSQADIYMKRENPLREVVEWDRSLAPRSVHDSAFRGLSETGEPVMLPQRVSAFINGKTRAGKSNYQQIRVAELSGCPDARAIVVDLKQRNARPYLKSSAVDWVITDPAEALAALRMLRAEIAARSREWDTGEEQALATPHVPALFLLVDEANPLTSEMSGSAAAARELAVVASQGAGVEVYCEVSTQYGALAESVQTEQTRMNLPLRACFAVEHKDHGTFALGDGAPDASRLEEKGEYLLKLGPTAKAEKVRAPHVPHSLLEQVCTENARRLRKPRLILFCGGEPSGIGNLTWQEWYDQRDLRIDPAFRAISPGYARAVEEFGEPQAEQAAPPAPAATVPAGSDGAEVARRIAAETAGPDASPSPEAHARARGERALCDALTAAGPDGISPADLKEASGLGNTAIHDKLGALLAAGAVTQAARRAPYVAVPGADLPGALAGTWKAGAPLPPRRLHAVGSDWE